MPVGITTWIKQDVLRGIPFQRRGCTGMGNPTTGIQAGRKIDTAFKGLCVTGDVPPQTPAWVRRRIAAIRVSLKKVGVVLRASNVLTKLGQLKTHIDGVGVHQKSGKVVVLELKSTQASLANHRKAYDIPCSLQPKVKVGGTLVANTERMHHAIQLAFGVHSLPTAHTGYVIVSASDGAALYPLNSGIALSIFTGATPSAPARSKAKTAAAPKRRRRGTNIERCTWPGARVVAPGWRDHKRVSKNVWVIAAKGKEVLATATGSPRGRLTAIKRARAAYAEMSSPPAGIHVFVRTNRRWICHRVK
tara:strand:+ start:11795 stop:12706 length:912 start_codon:yes stop_codon:yes gene_type:complete